MNVFNAVKQSVESYSVQGATMLWQGSGEYASLAQNLPLLIQQAQFTFQRSVQPQYPVNVAKDGTIKVVNISGPPQGQLTIQGLVSPNMEGLRNFIDTLGTACRRQEDRITLTIQPFTMGCSRTQQDANAINVNKENVLYTLGGVELQSFGISIQGGNLAMVTMPLQFIFTDLELNNG